MNIKQRLSAEITVVTRFIERQSDIKNNRFVFAYTISIENTSTEPFQLMSRHWVIKDGNGKIDEVYGEGVVGEQPRILADENYKYSSGAVLETEIGTMEGRYFMRSDQGDEFEVAIPKFVLSIPRTLH